MRDRMLGKTGMSVREVSLGCEHLQGKSEETVKAVIDAAIDAGMNIFDVFMSEPNVRTYIGRALAGRRDRVILQGHIGSCWVDGQYAVRREYDLCKSNFEDLLARLQTDYIDIGMLHFVDHMDDWEALRDSDTMRYALELKQKGAIRAIGMSSHNPVTAREAVESGLIEVLMFSLNPAFDLMPKDVEIMDLFEGKGNVFGEYRLEPARAALYRACETHGVGITVMKALGAGALLSQARSPLGAPLTVGQCINYALTRPAAASVLVGMQTAWEVREAARYFDLTAKERDYASALAAMPRFGANGRCMYCNHCLPCPSNIDIAAVNKYIDLVELDKTPAASVKAHYRALGTTAGECISCGDCEARCPFGVRVRERMAVAEALFGA